MKGKSFLAAFIIISILLPALFIPGADASTSEYNGYQYYTDGNSITITGYSGPGGVLVIPSTINTIPVVKIGDDAFLYAPILTLELSEGIRVIGNDSFYGCNGMIDVKLPSTITYIGARAFYACTALVSINLNEGLTQMGDSAFAYCTALGGASTVTIPSTLDDIEEYTFFNCNALTNLIILDGIDEIKSSAFSEMDALETVYIPGTVITIGESAFYRDVGLKNVIIGNGTTHILDHAFQQCYDLARVHMSQTVEQIGDYCFEYDFNLTTIAFNSGVQNLGHHCLAYSGITSIYMQMLTPPTNEGSWTDGVAGPITIYAFPWSTFNFVSGIYEGESVVDTLANFTYSGEHFVRYYGASNDFVVPYHTTGSTICRYIDDYAFYGNTDIKTLDMDGVTGYWVTGNYAFAYCTDLTTVYYDDTLSQMGTHSFYYDISLTTVSFLAGATVVEDDLEDSTFQYCWSLVSITLPIWVRDINQAAFYGCYALQSITFLGALHTIAYVAFAECHSLPQIDVPATVGTIGEASFFNCNSLWNVIINSGTTKVGSWAFQYCESLVSIDIPSSVTEIDDYAFEFCTSLASIDLGTGLVRLGYSAFHGCFALPEIFLPASLKQLGDNLTTLTAGVCDQCVSLTNINVHINNTEFTASGGVLFNKAKTRLIQFPAGLGGDYSVPSSVTYIMPGAFYYCVHLNTVTVNSGVTAINYACFASCANLTTVYLPDTVTVINDAAFQLSPKLSSMVIPNSVTYVGNNSFYFCSGLTSVTIGNHVQVLGELSFYACTSLTYIEIPDSVYLIDNYSFMFCSALNSIHIGQGIAWIGVAAFMHCDELISIYFYSEAPPTIDILWIEGTNANIRGYALATSSFPAPGEMLYTDYYDYELAAYDPPTGLLMADHFIPGITPPAIDTSDLEKMTWIIVFFLPIIIFGVYAGMTGIVVGTGIMSVVIGLTQENGYIILLVGLAVTVVYALNMNSDGD